MPRLIDADAMKSDVIGQVEFLKLLGGDIAEIADVIEKGFLQEIANAPTIDAVPVVRCKDCRNWERLLFDADSGCYCPFVDRYTTDDWYCADGERRDYE